jgi:dienelactone hydrolase
MGTTEIQARPVVLPLGAICLEGELVIPREAKGVVLFAHGSGSSRHSPRNQYVARVLQDSGIATLLFDLLTADEERQDVRTGNLRFDISLLADRLINATRWLAEQEATRESNIGYFGSSTGAAAALVAAAELGAKVGAVVSRGGRPDLAGPVLSRLTAATLLIVGGDDDAVIPLNRAAEEQLRCEKSLVVIPGATHLFEEPGALEQVSKEAAEWFARHL